MNINECIEQLNSLLEHFENGGNDFNATDVIAIKNLLEENKKLNGAIQTYDILLKANVEENKQLKDKLSKIETLIINHNCDTGDIYYKYNSKFLKSELKQRILEIVYEVSE